MTESQHPDPTTIRLLLIDDDAIVPMLVKNLLKKVRGKKFQIEWVSTYETGLEAIKGRRHDVYLLDYRLGAKSGLDLLREVSTLNLQSPIIVLTGADDPLVDFEATKIGAADFLVKDSLDTVTLERSIRYAIQHFETLRALQKSNERFRLLFERSLDAILISEDNGRFLEVNSAACLLFGFPREVLLQKKFSDFLTTEFDDMLHQSQDRPFGELSFLQHDGEHRFAEFSACRFAPNSNLYIVRDITDRRLLEREIQEISEREQRRLGQDLHDGLGQMLTGINFLAKVLQQKLEARQIDEAKEAANIVNLINQSLSQTRELALGLCPVVLESNDIYAALRQLSEKLDSFFGVRSELVCDQDIKIADNAVAVHLYRIAQEATTNAIKHGKCKKVMLSLMQSRNSMVLEIKDDGKGLPPAAVKKKGMGMRVMQHRARMINATLEITQPKLGGTLVTCTLENPTTKRKLPRKVVGKRAKLIAKKG